MRYPTMTPILRGSHDDDPYTTTPTHLRLYSDGREWFVDAADDEGHYSECCYSYDTFSEAVAGMAAFLEQTTELTFTWRTERTTP